MIVDSLDSRLNGDDRLAADGRPHSDSMVMIGSLQMEDHTLIDVLLANVYLDSHTVLPYYKGHCKVMCVSSPVYPVIIGNMRGARQMLPDQDWKAEDQPSSPSLPVLAQGSRARTSAGSNNEDDNQGGDMPSWMFKEESNREKTKNRDSVKKPAQLKKNNDHATQVVNVEKAPQKESILLDQF